MTHPRLADTIEHTFHLNFDFEGQMTRYIILVHWWAWFATMDRTALPDIELDRFWIYNPYDQEIIFKTLPGDVQSAILNAVEAPENLPDLETYRDNNNEPSMECC